MLNERLIHEKKLTENLAQPAVSEQLRPAHPCLPYSGIGFTGQAVLLALALSAFHTSLGGQPLFDRALLADQAYSPGSSLTVTRPTQ